MTLLARRYDNIDSWVDVVIIVLIVVIVMVIWVWWDRRRAGRKNSS